VEIEIPGVSVDPPYPRGTVLLERPNWKLETDNNGPGKSDLEFVFSPLANKAEVETATMEIATLIQAIREGAIGNRPVPLHSIEPSARNRATLNVEDMRFGGRLQATYGMTLEHLSQSIDELLPAKQAYNIHRNTATEVHCRRALGALSN
jgi:hypothetical protein